MKLLDLEGMERMGKPEWTIDRVLPARTVSMIYGMSNMGKSFWVLDMACCIASGQKWAGRAVKQGPVVYVAGEGSNGYWSRMDAWMRKHKGVRPERFRLIAEPVRLWSRSGETPETLGQLKDVVNLLGIAPALVVIDTLGTALGGADENDNGHMNQLADSAETLCREWGASVLLVHHVGKAGTILPRGAQALQDRMAMHAAFTGDGKTSGMLTCTKMKDGDKFEPIKRGLHRVALGDGQYGLSFADDYATGPREQKHRVSKEEVLAVLAHSAIPMTPAQIAEMLGCGRKAVGEHLRRLLDADRLARMDDGYVLRSVRTAA